MLCNIHRPFKPMCATTNGRLKTRMLVITNYEWLRVRLQLYSFLVSRLVFTSLTCSSLDTTQPIYYILIRLVFNFTDYMRCNENFLWIFFSEFFKIFIKIYLWSRIDIVTNSNKQSKFFLITAVLYRCAVCRTIKENFYRFIGTIKFWKSLCGATLFFEAIFFIVDTRR